MALKGDPRGVRTEERTRSVERLAAAPVDSVAAVERDAWNGLLRPGQAPLRHQYLHAWAQAELAGLRPRPLVARDQDGDVAAAAHAFFYDLDLAVVQSPFLAAAVNTVRRVWPRLMVSRAFEVGSSTPLVPPFLVRPGVDRAAAAEALLRAAIREADEGGAQMLIVQNFGPGDSVEARVLRSLGFSRVPIPPTVVVDLPHDDFEDHLGAMRAHYRRRARKTIKRSGHLQVSQVRDFGDLAPELARLWRLVYERAKEIKRELLPEEYFRAVAEIEESSVLCLRRDDGSIASFALLLDDEPWLHFLFTGFEEETGREEGAYFRLLYELVKAGTEGGFARVNMGMTTLPPKVDTGGHVVPLYAWLKHRHPRVQRVYAAAACGPFAPRPIEQRTVFKDEA
jgi:predicted N-acyltransferase